MIRFRNSLLAAVLGLTALVLAREAGAAAEVHRLNFIISGRPTSLSPGDFNAFIQNYNRNLEVRGVEPLKKITYGWLFDTEIRYLTRANVAIEGGVGQLRSKTKREILPGLEQDVQIQSEVLSVPIHVGASYYFSPYNQGDFQARGYLGGGLLSSVYNRARLQQVTSGIDPNIVPGFLKWNTKGDAPGFYVEGGVHMFFPSRFSVVLAANYRSAKIRDMAGTFTLNQQEFQSGRLFDLDLSGIGARMGLALGL